MTTPEVELRSVWRQVAGHGHDHLLDAVLARHREAHRRYHTLTHVMWVLRHITVLVAAGEPTADLAAVKLAALWHDAVYNTAATSVVDSPAATSAVMWRSTHITWVSV